MRSGDTIGLDELSLLRGMKSWNPRRRRGAGEALADLATPAAIDVLKRVASGGKRNFLRRHSLNDQLLAIECLGQSGRLEALAFLKYVYSPTITFTYNSYNAGYGSGGVDVTDTYEVCSYPNASPTLNRSLSFSIELSGYRKGEAEERHRHFGNRSHEVMRAAIEGLRVDTADEGRQQYSSSSEIRHFDFIDQPIQTRSVIELLERGVAVTVDISRPRLRSFMASIVYHTDQGEDYTAIEESRSKAAGQSYVHLAFRLQELIKGESVGEAELPHNPGLAADA